jgi:signal transduction histidine kinase
VDGEGGQRRPIQGVVALLISVGGSLVARALARELAVARLQSDFVAAVSHEFRSPLTAMKHLVEMLDQGAVQNDERRREYYRVLGGETERLHQMVETLLNFGRMEAGKAEYRFESLEVGALVEQVAAAFGDGVNVRERLTMSVAGPPVRVSADREALSRALWNLLDNAVKYSPPAAPLEVAVDAGAGAVSIRVRDHGPGIPAEERKQIFGKFFRGAMAKTTGVKGTGLGLATVQHIVRAHRGKVVVDSTPGEGSTFTIVLPALKEETS